MAELYSQYASGVQLSAGVITGSAYGVSGMNPLVDRLNSISPDDGVVSGAVVFADIDNISEEASPGTSSWISSNTNLGSILTVSDMACKVFVTSEFVGLQSLNGTFFESALRASGTVLGTDTVIAVKQFAFGSSDAPPTVDGPTFHPFYQGVIELPAGSTVFSMAVSTFTHGSIYSDNQKFNIISLNPGAELSVE